MKKVESKKTVKASGTKSGKVAPKVSPVKTPKKAPKVSEAPKEKAPTTLEGVTKFLENYGFSKIEASKKASDIILNKTTMKEVIDFFEEDAKKAKENPYKRKPEGEKEILPEAKVTSAKLREKAESIGRERDAAAKAAGTEKAKAKAKRNKPKRFTRTDAGIETIKELGETFSVKDFVVRSNEIYVEHGGKDNERESFWFIKYILPVLSYFGLFKVEGDKVQVLKPIK